MAGSVGGRVAGGEGEVHRIAAPAEAGLHKLGDNGDALQRRALGAGLRFEVAHASKLGVGRTDTAASLAWLSNENNAVCFLACPPPSIEARNLSTSESASLSLIVGAGGKVLGGRSIIITGAWRSQVADRRIKRLFPTKAATLEKKNMPWSTVPGYALDSENKSQSRTHTARARGREGGREGGGRMFCVC